MDEIYPYVKNTQIFTCPSFEGDAKEHEKYVNQPLSPAVVRGGTQFGTYVGNGVYTSMKAVSAHGPSGRPIADIKTPADTIFVTEGGDWGIDRSAEMVWTNNPVVSTTANPPYLHSVIGGTDSNVSKLVHNGGVNNVFCDGHAKWFKGENLVATHNVGSASTPICYLWTIEED